MAKLTGPLMSLGASGQLGKTLVYADWKGIKYARQHVVPANPNSAAQQTQRGYMQEAVALWHHIVYALNAVDKANLNREAAQQASAQSGFNRFTRNYVVTKVAGGTVIKPYDTTEGEPAAGEMEITVKTGVSTNNIGMRYGTSPTALVNSQARDEAPAPGTDHTFSLTGLTPGVRYYYRIAGSEADVFESLGIGSFVAA